MFGPAVLIAREKATNETELCALAQLAPAAEGYDQAELDFPRLMDERKAKRGARPPKLNKSTKSLLAGLEADQEALLAGLREQYASYLSPIEIISSPVRALENDIPMSANLLKYAETKDRPLVEARVENKRSLLKSLLACQARMRGESAA